MHVKLTGNGLYIDELLIKKNVTEVAEVTNLLGEPYREKSLAGDIRLFIFDDIGIRMWSRGNKVNQVQIVFDEAKPDENFPRSFYRGEVFIDGNLMSIPIYRSEIEEKVGKLTWDDDSRRFGVNIFKLTIGDLRFSFWLDKSQTQVESFYS